MRAAVVLLALCAVFFCVRPALAAKDQAQAELDKKAGDDFAAKDDLENAATAYIKALSEGHFSIDDRLRLATDISWGGRLPEAAEEFRAIVLEDPANHKARVSLAKTLSWMGDNKGALTEIEKALAQEPDDRDALLVKANALRLTGELKDAVALYTRLLKAKNDFDTRAGLAYALLAQGDRKAARARAASLKARYPYQERELKDLRAELAAAGDQEQALIDKKLGDKYAEKDDVNRAADAYSKALAHGQFSVADRMKMAETMSWAARYPEALEAYRGVTTEDPKNLKARIALAKTLSWMGDNKTALVEIETALRQEPGNRPALLVKANALRASGDLKAAIKLYNKILKAGDDFDARTGLAYALLAEGDRKAAADCAASLEDQAPHVPDDFQSRTGGGYALEEHNVAKAAQACGTALKAQYPYQERERKELVAELSADIKPAVEAQVPQATGGADEIGPLKKQLSAIKDKDQRAVLDKQIGDAYVAKDDFDHASGYYIDALSLGKFSVEDRMTLATRISWAEKLPAAAKEFKALVSEDPDNLKAGIALARTLSWMGDNAGALKEIDKVLGKAPGDRDALLVKANSLRLTGKLKDAEAIYRGLLQGEEDFSARVGLSYALLAEGDKKAAAEEAATAKAQFPYQEHELQGLNSAIRAGGLPTFYAGFSYYNDTEANNVERYSAGYSQTIHSVKLDVDYTEVTAKDTTPESNRAGILSLEVYKKLTGTFGLGGGVAGNQTQAGTQSEFLTWNVKADEKLQRGALGASAVSYLMTDTAQLINNNIRATSYGFSAWEALATRVQVNATYSYKDYSDNNGSNDAQAWLSYFLVLNNPRIAVGYKERFLGFRRQSGSGYYDPSSNIAEQIFTNISFDTGKFYGYVEGYGGYMTQHRNAIISSEYFGGGSGVIGWKLFRHLTVEGTAEGGNYSVQNASGFEYYQLGAKISYIP